MPNCAEIMHNTPANAMIAHAMRVLTGVTTFFVLHVALPSASTAQIRRDTL